LTSSCFRCNVATLKLDGKGTLRIVCSFVVAAACSHDRAARPVDPIASPARVPVDAAVAVQETKPDAQPPPAVPDEDIDSKDILARDATTSPVLVKHVLIAWSALEHDYGGGRLDSRASFRNNAAAAKLAREVLAKLQANPKQIDELVMSIGEDPGAQLGEPYEVTANAAFVPEFKQLSLRLHIDEAGIVRTRYGYHVIMRVAPPPPDPLESAAILARPEGKGPVLVQHILISWKESSRRPDDPRAERTKADADSLAKSLLERVRRGGKMDALMKQYSEDPGSKDDAKAYEVSAESPMVEPFKKLALRLKLGEAGLAKSPFGWHVMKRIPPPPADKLASAEILKRTPTTGTVKVKHILLGWTAVHTDDPRGTIRSRSVLEQLVKETLTKLRGGAAIEPLMAELSEDPGSAKSGESYDVSPDAPLVSRFKDLSLRLKVGEVGVIDTEFGIHIIQRSE
jgi:parvulin-like peptidyl-prolyl isomerase